VLASAFAFGAALIRQHNLVSGDAKARASRSSIATPRAKIPGAPGIGGNPALTS